jgi:hypothetical protein
MGQQDNMNCPNCGHSFDDTTDHIDETIRWVAIQAEANNRRYREYMAKRRPTILEKLAGWLESKGW